MIWYRYVLGKTYRVFVQEIGLVYIGVYVLDKTSSPDKVAQVKLHPEIWLYILGSETHKP